MSRLFALAALVCVLALIAFAASGCASLPTAAQLRAAYCATVTDAGREVIADKATGRPIRLIACEQRSDLPADVVRSVDQAAAPDALPADAGEPVAALR